MKRRKNAVYTGQSKRGVRRPDRYVVNSFYKHLNYKLRPEDEIEIIPPEQVNPTHDRQEQLFIVADYCVRKILPELTSLFHWGDEVTPRLRALAPVVDSLTADAADAAAEAAAEAAADAADAAEAAYDTADAFATARSAIHDVCYAASYANAADRAAAARRGIAKTYALYAARFAVSFVHDALVACIEADHEAAYNRIIELTNEMLESL